jgi:quercetin dioxygenase-like cupin family protein
MSDRRPNNSSAASPLVPVRRSRSGRGLIVDKCPHCFERHVHGAAGERGPWHGHRAAHCRDPLDARVGYVLVESPSR